MTWSANVPIKVNHAHTSVLTWDHLLAFNPKGKYQKMLNQPFSNNHITQFQLFYISWNFQQKIPWHYLPSSSLGSLEKYVADFIATSALKSFIIISLDYHGGEVFECLRNSLSRFSVLTIQIANFIIIIIFIIIKILFLFICSVFAY
jgi:hypothetical protein